MPDTSRLKKRFLHGRRQVAENTRSPQALGRQYGTVDERLELQPSGLRMAGVKANESCEAVIANLFQGHARENVVEDLDSSREVCRRVGKITALDPAVKRHRGVWRIELQGETGINNRLVF